MLDSTTLRNKDSARVTTKTQLAVNAPLLLSYLKDFLNCEESKDLKDITPYQKLETRLEEIVRMHYPSVDLENWDQQKKKLGKHLLKWKVDLLESEKHWVSWFTGITQQFLNKSKLIYNYFLDSKPSESGQNY